MRVATKRSVAIVPLVSHIVLILGSLAFVVPFLWMLLTSLKTLGESTHVPPVIIPANLQWSNFSEVLATLPFFQFYINTLLMAAGRTLGQLFFCSLAAYAFARIEFPGRDALFVIALSALMIPTYLLLLPQYLIMKDLGWLNSLQALIVPGLFSAFGTFLLRQFFLTIPKELDEAARIDGANHFQIYWQL